MSSNSLSIESPSVHIYLSHLQAIISRMAGNSTSCKTWCITLISVITVFAADKGQPDTVWMALIPLGLFFLLDSYYLGLERLFRSFYNEFVGRLHAGLATQGDLFVLTPPSLTRDSIVRWTATAMLSISIWPFYALTTLLLLILRTRIS